MLNYLAQHFLLSYALIAIGGIIIGSLLTIIIYRFPLMLQREWRKQCVAYLQLDEKNYSLTTAPFHLCKPNSYCPHCQHPIHWLAKIPLLSYILLRGQCQHCTQTISLRYPAIEILTGILAVYLAITYGESWQFILAFIFSCMLICLIFIDLDHQLLPDQLTLSLLWLGLIANIGHLFCPLQHAVIGAISGYVALWSISYLFKLVSGREGMGHGDFKLLAALGAWLGWQMLPLIILISSITGAIIGLYLILFKAHQRHIPIPFGPYLAIAGWIVLFWGKPLLRITTQIGY